jgi:hypothetical protein
MIFPNRTRGTPNLSARGVSRSLCQTARNRAFPTKTEEARGPLCLSLEQVSAAGAANGGR